MSKRFYPQQYGGNKKAKLDMRELDHNFPQSQLLSNENNNDIWDDDIDEDILLQASEVIEHNLANESICTLPDYSLCMRPASTSTQYYLEPNVSREAYTFKKPNALSPVTSSMRTNNNCQRIASPMPEISKDFNNINGNVSNNSTFHDRVYKKQDSVSIYRQLLQCQEENEKLKAENGRLVEKCLTKEGEVSIIRAQLKSSQAAVDKARMEKVKTEEKAQIELNEKIALANKQIHDLKMQLDYQNIEIMNTKEKCKLLESSKVKLTQVIKSDASIMSTSMKNTNSTQHNNIQLKSRSVQVKSDAVKTVKKSRFLKVTNINGPESSIKLNEILPLVLEPTAVQKNILDYSEELQKRTDTIKCTVYSTCHRLLFTPCVNREVKTVVGISDIHDDVTCMATLSGVTQKKLSHMLTVVKLALREVCSELETILERMERTAFQKEMTERYIEASSSFIDVDDTQLVSGKALYREEQAIVARRMVAILAIVLETPKNLDLFTIIETYQDDVRLFDLISRICGLIEDTFTGIVYSGLLHSMLILLNNTMGDSREARNAAAMATLKCVGRCRASHMVVYHTARIVAPYRALCDKDSHATIKVDDRGLFSFEKDTCFVLIISKQAENTLRCIERNDRVARAIDMTRDLVELCYSTSADSAITLADANRRSCFMTLLQVITYALRICAVMLKAITESATSEGKDSSVARELRSVLWGGARCLYAMVSRDAALQVYEGHLQIVLEIMDQFAQSKDDKYVLSELLSGLQYFGDEQLTPYFELTCTISPKEEERKRREILRSNVPSCKPSTSAK